VDKMRRTTAVDGYARSLHNAHAEFLGAGRAPVGVRGLVADSWLRSAAAGVDADANLAPIALADSDLTEYREAHPLSPVFPLLYDVLGRTAEECDSLMAIGDTAGNLLWVCGRPDVLRRAERINFVAGAAWDEARAGTNAPGTALRLDAPVQIHAAEHFTRPVQRWSCAAAPIHDPETQAILGIVDVTGNDDVASPMTMGMVRAAARMAEGELARLVAIGRGQQQLRLWSPTPASPLHVAGLGRSDCQVQVSDRTMVLSPRHSEIMVILLDHPDGMTGDQLAIQLYRDDVQTSTMRVEMTRLRAQLGPDVLDSRPYRLRISAECDWQAVPALLAAGRVREAMRAYRGPLLPQSDAPGVVQRRESIERQLRTAVLASAEPDLMVAWTRSRWGAEDLQMWQRQARTLPPTSPLRPLAIAEARRLDYELRAPMRR
jgi:hypothetical protein